ncbi:hypothetical protein CWO89_02135 [Bradyrhizobium sp. Leo170]|nr:hypothetical protein CWO89_02135 [Bradyrhizobium sp. Leo170]
MGKDKIRYFLYLEGRWRWRPTKAMRKAGFRMVPMGKGGPGRDAEGNPAASKDDLRRAVELNAEWDAHRRGGGPARKIDRPSWAEGSVGDGYVRAMALRKADRTKKGIVWTYEQESRDDWPRAWKWLGPEFGDCDPNTIEPEHFLRIDEVTGGVSGLLVKIESEVSIGERHRVLKVWRALWKRMAAMKYCKLDADPSKAITNTPPDPRQATWLRKEVLKLVQVAWRHGFFGLAACMAVAWDSMLSPVDARKLLAGMAIDDGAGILFLVDRAKTGRGAAGTLSQWSQAILLAYMKKQFEGITLLENTPLFWTRGHQPVSRKGELGQRGGDRGGGRPTAPRPYRKQTLADDFRTVRELAFGIGEKRQIQDMRRSGAVEGDAGGGSVTDQSNKMANTVEANKRLRKTYNPVNIASVRRFDEARAIGAKKLEQKPDTDAPILLEIFKTATGTVDR